MARMSATKPLNQKMRMNVSDPLPALHDGDADAPRSPRREGLHLALPCLRENVCESFVIGRVWCEPCGIVAQVVRHPDAVITCPHCDGPTIEASGDEV